MTREEALAETTRQLENARNTLKISKSKTVLTATVNKIDYLVAVQAALRPVSREQVEKAWRGEWEWYDEEIGSPLDGIEREWGWRCSKCKVVLPDDFDDPDNPPAMRFCQWCGAPMTDEAVDMVMERLNKLEETKK